MMNDGWMMWGMGFGHLIVVALVILALAALIKYVFLLMKGANFETT